MKAPKPNAGFDFSSKEAREALNCIAKCFSTNNPVPVWAQKALIEAIARANSFDVKSWDEVFGRLLEKGKHLRVERRRLALPKRIFERVRERHKAGESITRDLFERVGGEFGVKRTEAEKIYYGAVEDIINQPEIFDFAVKSTEE
jgi:hypothetical protein